MSNYLSSATELLLTVTPSLPACLPVSQKLGQEMIYNSNGGFTMLAVEPVPAARCAGC